MEVLFVKFPTSYKKHSKSWNLHILLKKRVINIFFHLKNELQLLVCTLGTKIVHLIDGRFSRCFKIEHLL